MNVTYVLIDYENVQPRDLALLQGKPFRVKVFLGANQARIPVALASALQPLGSNAEYVLLESSGRNALDLAIAFSLGQLSCMEPEASFVVISNDSGFDPLVRRLQGNGLTVWRRASVNDIPSPDGSVPQAETARLELVVSDLIRRKAAKPRTQKTLLRTMDALFKRELSGPELKGLFESLCKQGIVTIEGMKVAYALPALKSQEKSSD